MSLGQAIEAELNKEPESGLVEATVEGSHAQIDLMETDRLGVKLRGVRIHRHRTVEIVEEVEILSERLRSLGERVVPTEIAPELGGAILRTQPEEIRDREFFEIEIQAQGEVEIRRWKAESGVERQPVDWTMTRRQLERLIDDLS